MTGKGALERKPDDPPGFSSSSVDLGETFDKYSYRKRWVQERRYASLAAGRIRAFAPEVVLSSNTPLFAQRILQPEVRKTGARFVFWQQDIYSVAMGAAARGAIPIAGGMLARVFEHMERRLLAASDHIVVISSDFVEVLRRWRIPDDRIDVIENWAPIDELPVTPTYNAWRAEVGLDDRRVVLYSGTLGLKHNPQLLLDLAERLTARGDAQLVVVSEGRGADWLRERAGTGTALVQLPFQPFERMPEVFGSADVLTAILEPEAGVFSVPSKVLSYHCAGRALLAAIPRGNLAARIIERAGSGIAVAPDDIPAFVAGAERLLDSDDLRASMGTRARAYAQGTFDIGRITDRFETLLRG